MISSSGNFTICRDVADGFDFGKGKSARADLRVRDLRQILRARKFPAGKKLFEPGQNRVRRHAVELLVRDCLHERLKRRPALFRREIAFPVLANQPPQNGIALGQMLVGRGCDMAGQLHRVHFGVCNQSCSADSLANLFDGFRRHQRAKRRDQSHLRPPNVLPLNPVTKKPNHEKPHPKSVPPDRADRRAGIDTNWSGDGADLHEPV